MLRTNLPRSFRRGSCGPCRRSSRFSSQRPARAPPRRVTSRRARTRNPRTRRSAPRPTPSSRRSTPATPRRWRPSGPPTGPWPTTGARFQGPQGDRRPVRRLLQGVSRGEDADRRQVDRLPHPVDGCGRWNGPGRRPARGPTGGEPLHGRSRPGKREMAHGQRPRDDSPPAVQPCPTGRPRLADRNLGDQTRRDDRGASFRWIANKSFIERNYTVRQDGVQTASGVQIIGWDPQAGQIRSWSFDASGGYGSSLWTATPDGWRAESSGVLADGTPTSSQEVLIRVPGEDNVLGWRSFDRSAGDAALADTPEVVLDRIPEKR